MTRPAWRSPSCATARWWTRHRRPRASSRSRRARAPRRRPRHPVPPIRWTARRRHGQADGGSQSPLPRDGGGGAHLADEAGHPRGVVSALQSAQRRTRHAGRAGRGLGPLRRTSGPDGATSRLGEPSRELMRFGRATTTRPHGIPRPSGPSARSVCPRSSGRTPVSPRRSTSATPSARAPVSAQDGHASCVGSMSGQVQVMGQVPAFPLNVAASAITT